MPRRAVAPAPSPGSARVSLAGLFFAALLWAPGPAAAQEADREGVARHAPAGSPVARGSLRPPGHRLRSPADTLRFPPDALPSSDDGAELGPWVERAAGLATLLAADRAVRGTTRDLRRDAPEASVADDLAQFGNDVGTWHRSAPFLVGGALVGGTLLDGLRGAGRGASLLAGVLAGSMASEAINRAVGRGRPSWDRGVYSFRPFTGHASFPSGHTAYLFSVAGGVDALTDGWLPAAAAYGLAGISAYGRLYADQHWVSDVVVGAVLGSTVSRVATRRAMRLLGVAGSGGEPDGALAAPGHRDPEVSLLATPGRIGVRIRF